MNSFFREHFKSADGDFIVVFLISLLTVSFSDSRKYDLDITLRTEGSTFDERRLGCYTPQINVESGLNIVQGISHHIQITEEFVRVDVFRLFFNSLEASDNVSL